MDSTNLISIEQAVTRYLFKYKRMVEDYPIYLEHAGDCLREFMTYDSKEYCSEKVAVSSLGIIEMPNDLLAFKGVYVAKDGEWWSFTERPDKVNTTTETGGVETHDSTFGEGVNVKDGISTTYGARGAVNEYYYMIDWKARRIFCDGIVSDTVLLKYVSSGINFSGTTYIPEYLIEVHDPYLRWMECFWIDKYLRFAREREQNFVNARIKVRNRLNALSKEQWQDLIWGSLTQTPKR